MRVRQNTLPKPIKYADQTARERRAQGLLLTPPIRKASVLDDVIAELRHRMRCAPDGGRDLVRWLTDARCIAPWVSKPDTAIEELRLCPEARLYPVAQALGLRV